MKKLAIIALTLALTGCDGSESSDQTEAENNTNTYPVSAVIQKVWEGGYPHDLFHTDLDDLEISPISIPTMQPKTAIFDGKKVLQSDSLELVTKGGVSMAISSEKIYYTTEPLAFVGLESDEYYIVATTNESIPLNATIGDSGKIYSAKKYKTNKKDIFLEDINESWQLKNAGNNNAELCVNTSNTYKIYIEDDVSSSFCLTINTKGDILKSTLTLSSKDEDGSDSINVFASK